jgi:endonuclease/exonuclease/phosphatase family metal-dependent hydrolase
MLLIILIIASNIFTQALAKSSNKSIKVMSLNIYGWKTMPKHSVDYAQLIKSHKIDILGIQEGVDDWQLKVVDLKNGLPTNYKRASRLKTSLGECWRHQFQIFINFCQGNRFVETGRFDLTDGPNATRTGEYAVIEKNNSRFLFVNVHWDHESTSTKIANAEETGSLLNKFNHYPKILIGDFNSHCDSSVVSVMQSKAEMVLLKSAGIDCLFVNGITGNAEQIKAPPSDHPAIIATLLL